MTLETRNTDKKRTEKSDPNQKRVLDNRGNGFQSGGTMEQ